MEMVTRLDCTEYRYMLCRYQDDEKIWVSPNLKPMLSPVVCICSCCVSVCSSDFVSFHIHIICHWPLFLFSTETKNQTNKCDTIPVPKQSGSFCSLFCAQSFYVGCHKIYTHQNGAQFISRIKDEWGWRRKSSFIMCKRFCLNCDTTSVLRPFSSASLLSNTGLVLRVRVWDFRFSLDAATIFMPKTVQWIERTENYTINMCAVIVYEKFCQKYVPFKPFEFHILIDKWLDDIKDWIYVPFSWQFVYIFELQMFTETNRLRVCRAVSGVHGVCVWGFLRTERLAYFQTKMRFLLGGNASEREKKNQRARKKGTVMTLNDI